MCKEVKPEWAYIKIRLQHTEIMQPTKSARLYEWIENLDFNVAPADIFFLIIFLF